MIHNREIIHKIYNKKTLQKVISETGYFQNMHLTKGWYPECKNNVKIA